VVCARGVVVVDRVDVVWYGIGRFALAEYPSMERNEVAHSGIVTGSR
jgi:hypothetical protein